MTIKIVNESEKVSFNAHVNHPLQSWEWGDFRQKQGLGVVRFGLYARNTLKQAYQLTLHPIPLTPFTIGYLPKSNNLNKTVLNYLRKLGKDKRSIFIKIEPNVQQKKQPWVEIDDKAVVRGKPLFTKFNSIIDLTRCEKDILNSFKPKTKYNVKVAEKHGVVVKEDNSPLAFETYLKLLLETTKRQGFYAHNEAFHRTQWQITQKTGMSHLLTATHQGKILAAHLFFVFNKTLYYPYGASTRESRQVMAPTLLMWEAIKFGKKMGCTSFDLWGDIEPNPPENHPYFGFHRFKEGFSPKLVEHVGTYDLIIDPTWYRIYRVADRWRWALLRLRAKLR